MSTPWHCLFDMFFWCSSLAEIAFHKA